MPPAVIVGEPFEIVVRVEWPGQVDDYFLLPPKVKTPEDITPLGSSVTTTNEGDTSILAYRYTFVAQEVGTLDIPEVMIRYQPIAGGPEGQVALAVAPLYVSPPSKEQTSSYFMLAAVVGVFILLAFLMRKRFIQENLS